jgi:BolA protein
MTIAGPGRAGRVTGPVFGVAAGDALTAKEEFSPMSVAAALRERLRSALAPTRLEIADESARHHGHAGSRPEGETHFSVLVVSAAFVGRSRLERQRLVNEAAADLLRERIHALSVRALAPGADAPSATPPR